MPPGALFVMVTITSATFAGVVKKAPYLTHVGVAVGGMVPVEAVAKITPAVVWIENVMLGSLTSRPLAAFSMIKLSMYAENS